MIIKHPLFKAKYTGQATLFPARRCDVPFKNTCQMSLDIQVIPIYDILIGCRLRKFYIHSSGRAAYGVFASDGEFSL